jgi:predicted nucleic acid-binding protein
MRTYLDSCVLIAAWKGEHAAAERIYEILNDSTREFVVSDFIKLEVIPKPTFNKNNSEVQFYNEFFKGAATNISPSSEVTDRALDLACKYDLEPMDAIHAGAALFAKADEFITLEKPEKPLHRIKEVRVITFYQPS